MKNIKISIILFCATLCISCADVLDKFPLSQMSPDTFFSNANELESYSNAFYNCFPSESIYSQSFDDITTTNIALEMVDGRIVPNSGGGWSWGYLRNFNTLLEFSSNCTDLEVRQEYDALARFFRAYFYFEKVKRYGDVPWFSKPLGSADPELMRPRDSREFIMQKMIEDIDYAIEYLPVKRSLYRVTKWTALALKSRFCLFEGTFRKYHSIDNFEHDYKWYLEQAASASEDFIVNSGYSLYNTGNANTTYVDLFTSTDAQPQEVILARDYNLALGVTHNANYFTLSKTYGLPGMTRKMVDSYLTSTGSRFTDKENYQTMSYVEQMTNRDPRLKQTVLAPGYKRKYTNEAFNMNLSLTVTGYQLIKFLAGKDGDTHSQSNIDLPLFRSAEVYLNFAEAKAELGTLTQNDIDISIKKLRDRVGMPNLSLSDANASPDPYLISETTGYPSVSGANQGVILEIRRERCIELMQEGFRYYDIIRWHEGKTFEAPIYGIYIPHKGENDLDGDGSMDVYFAEDGEKPSTSAPIILYLNKDVNLSNGDNGYIMPHKLTPGIWDEERDYFYPIPTNERALTQGALSQNPGWVDGLSY